MHTAFQRIPAFRCRRDALTGARELYDLFTPINLSADDFRSRAYTRLKQLDHLLTTRQVDDRLLWRAA